MNASDVSREPVPRVNSTIEEIVLEHQAVDWDNAFIAVHIKMRGPQSRELRIIMLEFNNVLR